MGARSIGTRGVLGGRLGARDVEEVGSALALHEHLWRFAAEAEGLDDAALQTAWRAW